jgi:hypothetical protein
MSRDRRVYVHTLRYSNERVSRRNVCRDGARHVPERLPETNKYQTKVAFCEPGRPGVPPVSP